MKNKHVKTYAVLLLLTVVFITGCSGKAPLTSAQFVMDTVVNTALYGGSDEDLEAISVLLSDCESQLLSEIPAGAQDDLDGLVSETGGAFDYRIGRLTELWGIGTDHARVPSPEEIASVLDDRMQIDPGAYGKGYACDVLKDYLKENGIGGACIAVGGSVLCYGAHDGRDEYIVAIRDPRGAASDYIGTIKVRDKTVSTSGDYEHVFEENGKKYHHILDPRTGYPVNSGLTSVTVVCGSGLMSDALSTAAFSLGLEEGMELLEKYGAEGIFIGRDMNIYTTAGIDLTVRDGSK